MPEGEANADADTAALRYRINSQRRIRGTGHFTRGWIIGSANPSPLVSNALSHNGTYAAFAGGSLPLQFCGFGNEPSGDSSFYQEFGPVPANATLSFWHWDCTTDSIDFDWQDALTSQIAAATSSKPFSISVATANPGLARRWI